MIGVNGTDGKNLSTNNILIDDWGFDRKTCRPVRIAAVESNRVVLEGRPGNKHDIDNLVYRCSAYYAFSYLIDKVFGDGTWRRNPWVFAYLFEPIR